MSQAQHPVQALAQRTQLSEGVICKPKWQMMSSRLSIIRRVRD